MFGFVQANMMDLSKEEQARYRAAYCGLCHTLGTRHGFTSRMSLTYDLTFLTLLLSSLYEPEEDCGECRCVVHPCKKHTFITNECTEYAADMTIALTYHKCLDDWEDERKVSRRCYASSLKKSYETVKNTWPEQCSAIETCIQELSTLERARVNNPDAAAKCFGRLMESIFLYRKDPWEESLRLLGNGLGQYIYLADAAIDLEHDKKHRNFNPLTELAASQADLRPTLTMVLGDAARGFEHLPLVKDIHLLRNILYSGLWIKYNQGMQKSKKVKT